MKHHLNWRIGLMVIVVLVITFAVVYPSIYRQQNLPVRDAQDIRNSQGIDESTARRAVQTDLNP